MLITGSYAIKKRLKSFRDYNDIDLWMSAFKLEAFYNVNQHRISKFEPQYYKNKFNLVIDGQRVELGLYEPGGSGYDLLYRAQLDNLTTNLFGFEWKIPTLKTLFAIKQSHIYYPVKWHKHIRDYHKIKLALDNSSTLGAGQDDKLLDEAKAILTKSAAARFKARQPNLNLSNEEFFERSQGIVKRIYNHDDLHKAVAYHEQPMYMHLKRDQSSAKCEKDLWDLLHYEYKIKAVQEEAFVIALERFIIPNGGEASQEQQQEAFDKALMKICTTLTGGWFREFAVENWPNCRKFTKDYVGEFQEQLRKDKIRKY